ncbi:unnamed protein product [Rotaria sp. Silwood1]|nr:unnamed protein product [Rotaria sp. Silwood1]CAF1547579.1 unnamed protein product [Rotaria sp. Silwood1]
MEKLVVKCLNKREKCFEINSCPIWLLSILPNRIKSIEKSKYNDNEDKIKERINDISTYKYVNLIELFNENKRQEEEEEEEEEEYINYNIEYPNNIQYSNDLFSNYSQLIYSPSNKQFSYLFNILKQYKYNINKTLKEKEKEKEKSKCKILNCLNRSIPLTNYCQIHLIEYDNKQILFIICNLCQHISIKNDNNFIIHHCPYNKT